MSKYFSKIIRRELVVAIKLGFGEVKKYDYRTQVFVFEAKKPKPFLYNGQYVEKYKASIINFYYKMPRRTHNE